MTLTEDGLSAPAPAGHNGRRELTPRIARRIGLLFAAGFLVAMLVQPAPDGPQPVPPVWLSVVYDVTSIALLASWAMLLIGRRSGLWASLTAGVSLSSLSAACPLTDHHEIAPWWFVQLGVGVGMAVASVALLLATRRPADR